MLKQCTLLTAAAAVAAMSSQALAAPVALHYSDVEQGTRDGFGFSVIHHPTNASGAGDILYRLVVSSLDVVWDDAAGSLSFVGLQGRLFEENNLNPSTLGPEVGSLTLNGVSTLSLNASPVAGSDPLAGAGGEFLDGQINFSMTLFGADMAPGGGDDTLRDFTIRFVGKHYNNLANRFNPQDAFSLGLWGATPEVFTSGSTADSLAMDLFGSNPIVPLPTAAGLGALGMGLLGLRRRSRC